MNSWPMGAGLVLLLQKCNEEVQLHSLLLHIITKSLLRIITSFYIIVTILLHHYNIIIT